MAEVCVARAGDVNGCTDGYEDDDEGVDGWSGVLVADRDYDFVCVVGCCWGGEGGFLLVEGECGLLGEVGWGYGRGVGGVCGEWAVVEEGDCDAELGCEPERDVEETGP
jgi:hypothetical protein